MRGERTRGDRGERCRACTVARRDPRLKPYVLVFLRAAARAIIREARYRFALGGPGGRDPPRPVSVGVAPLLPPASRAPRSPKGPEN